MAEKTRQHTSSPSLDSFTEFEDHELRSTMRDFLEEEEKEKQSIWNVATIAGIAMFFVSMIYIVQLIGLEIGPGLSGLMNVLPFIGAFLVAFVGFGYFVGDRKRVKKVVKKQKERRKDYFEKEFPKDQFDSNDDVDLEEELFGNTSSKGSAQHRKKTFDHYALRQSKKLYKSRTDKKWAGVCGGLAKYFGISSTVIRVLFVITFFASSGSTLLVYIALSLALDKEPPELMDDFNF
ncbi:MAG: PspC domain-containing protein [Balneolaceae bacterium]|nr:PspC domain-containing protein [Balneolaceae bacterium]